MPASLGTREAEGGMLEALRVPRVLIRALCLPGWGAPVIKINK